MADIPSSLRLKPRGRATENRHFDLSAGCGERKLRLISPAEAGPKPPLGRIQLRISCPRRSDQSVTVELRTRKSTCQRVWRVHDVKANHFSTPDLPERLWWVVTPSLQGGQARGVRRGLEPSDR